MIVLRENGADRRIEAAVSGADLLVLRRLADRPAEAVVSTVELARPADTSPARMLVRLRKLEKEFLVSSISLSGGLGVGWTLTNLGQTVVGRAEEAGA